MEERLFLQVDFSVCFGSQHRTELIASHSNVPICSTIRRLQIVAGLCLFPGWKQLAVVRVGSPAMWWRCKIRRSDGNDLATCAATCETGVGSETNKANPMKQVAVLTLLVALAAGCCMPIEARNAYDSRSEGQTAKSAQEQQKALYKYQKKQEKAQAKAQRTADKQQRKAAKKYEKEQRRLLKNANVPAKRTP